MHKATLMKEINCLVSIGAIKRQPSLQLTSPSFIIPKKDHTVHTISDFSELNKGIAMKPYPIPKISTTLQELEGFTYATALYFKHGLLYIRLGPTASKMCTIIFLWGKYSYLRLSTGFAGLTDFFPRENE
jgi:hypothetical protein